MMNIPPFLRQALAENRRALTSLALVKAAAGVLTVGGAFCTAHILAAVIDGTFAIEKAVPLFLGLLFVVLGKALLVLPARRVQDRLMLDAEERVRARIHATLLARSPLALVPETGGQLVGLACESVGRLDGAFTTVLPAMIDLVVLVPLYLVVFACTDAWTALLALVTLPIAPFLLYLIGLVTKERSAQEYCAMMRMGKTFAELLRAIPMMKLFCRERAERERVAVASERFRVAALAVLRTAFVSAFALELITTLSIALIAVSLGLRLVAGSIGFEPAFFVLLLAPAFYAPLANGGTSFHAGMEAMEAWRAVKAFVIDDNEDDTANTSMDTTKNTQENKAHSDAAHPDDANARDTLSFDSVTCAYPGRTAPAVHDVSFDVPRGKVTLLRGTSGAGKSTLLALALGFLQQKTGTIHRPQAMAYVPQEPHIFAATLRENLLLGRTADDSVLVHAMERAGLASILERLPEGLDTMLGEGSRALSNGERRRLGLARALIAPADAVLLDEVTAGLDEENEGCVLQTIYKLRGMENTPAILMASHRTASLEIADCIMTLDSGTLLQIARKKKPLPPGEVPSVSEAERVSKVRRDCIPHRAVEGSPKGTSSGCTPQNRSQPYLRHPFRRSAGATFPAGEGFRGSLLSSLASLFHSHLGSALFRISSLIRLLPAPLTFLALLSALFADACAILLLGASAWLIASAAFHPHLYALAVAITAVRATGIGRAVFRYLDRYLSHRAVFTLLTRLRLAVYDLACVRLPERRPGASSGVFLQQAAAGIDEQRDFYLRALFPLVRIIVLALAATWFVGRIDATLAPVPLACLCLLILVARFSRMDNKTTPAEAGYRTALLDVFAGRTEIAAFHAKHAFTARLDACARAISNTRQSLLWREAVADAVAEALPSLAWVALFFAMACALPEERGQADGVWLCVYVLVLETVVGFFSSLVDVIRKSRLSFLIAPTELPSVAITSPAENRRSGSLCSAGSITFSYAPSFPVFRNLSFSLRPSEKLVLLGESGAGKTTLFHLLTRLWEADAGTFSLGGRPYEALAVEDVRAAFAAATQAGYVFSGSIHENFQRLLPAASGELRRRALSLACCDDFIATLPQGVDTPLGENGVRLSGGQRQRLLVAFAVCALLAAPQKILLLDEPTTGVDRKTAGRLLKNLMDAFPAQAMILILHDRDLAGRILARDDARTFFLSPRN
ncbi:ATP-binding cassette domain-containing protein [Selenomonas sp.]|uniref:ATP-binding cassette domain-containing protein n=1 Tax=Selenomonas sp. TaxID=2053611 RepID=UPI0025FC8E69|nr:ATP-binding cassette domain-containing protein [Selenomonas sp.]MCI6283283.1 ATP-binding cassette domain-containing protein [Selenomonas sp.]